MLSVRYAARNIFVPLSPLVLLMACDGGGTTGGTPAPSPTPAPTPSPTPTPTPSPTPTPTPTPTSPYYTAYDDFAGTRTLWMGCGRTHLPQRDFGGKYSLRNFAEFEVTVDRVAGSILLNSQQDTDANDKPFLISQRADPKSYDVRPVVNEAWTRPYTNYHADVVTGSIVDGDYKYLYAKDLIYRQDSKFLTNNFYCTTGIATRYADIPAGVTTFTNGKALGGRLFPENQNIVRSVDASGSTARLTVNKTTNVVTIIFTVIHPQNPNYPPDGVKVYATDVTGTGKLDPVTGRFSGQLQPDATAAETGFIGQLYGPKGSEAGAAITGTGIDEKGARFFYSFSFAAHL